MRMHYAASHAVHGRTWTDRKVAADHSERIRFEETYGATVLRNTLAATGGDIVMAARRLSLCPDAMRRRCRALGVTWNTWQGIRRFEYGRA